MEEIKQAMNKARELSLKKLYSADETEPKLSSKERLLYSQMYTGAVVMIDVINALEN